MLSILYSTSRCLQAFERYDIARKLKDTEEAQVSSVHEAMGHAASLSKFFWPSGLGDKRFAELKHKRAERLKSAFNVRDDSPLRNRELRDSLEHFDERLDLYFLENDSGYFFPSAIVGDANLADEPTGNIFKLVDPENQVFVVLGKKFAFGEIRAEVTRIAHGTLQKEASGGRLYTDVSTAGE